MKHARYRNHEFGLVNICFKLTKYYPIVPLQCWLKYLLLCWAQPLHGRADHCKADLQARLSQGKEFARGEGGQRGRLNSLPTQQTRTEEGGGEFKVCIGIICDDRIDRSTLPSQARVRASYLRRRAVPRWGHEEDDVLDGSIVVEGLGDPLGTELFDRYFYASN